MWADVSTAGAPAWTPPATLPGADYHSLETFDDDRRSIFHRTWFCVGRDEDVGDAPGSFAPVDVAGESVLLLRAEDVGLRAFLNACRHRGSRLCDEPGRAGRALVCPYHAWS